MKKILPILVLVAISLELGLIALAAEDAGGELSGVQQTEAVSGQGEAAAAADETAPSPAGDASPVSPTDITSEGTVSPTNLMVYCVVTYNPNGGTLASGTSSTSTVAYRYAYGAMPAASTRASCSIPWPRTPGRGPRPFRPGTSSTTRA